MIEIVINYDPAKGNYKIYEPTTDTLMVSSNLTEAMVNLSGFLESAGMIKTDILNCLDISYHFDSYTMKAMIESNVNLLKRLKTAPSGFMIANQRFGGSTGTGNTMRQSDRGDGGNKKYKKSESKFSGRSGGFSGKTGFGTSNKKFGGIR